MTPDELRIRHLADGFDPNRHDDDGLDVAGLDDLRSLLASPELWEEPADDLEHRIVAAISEAAQRGAGDAPSPDAPAIDLASARNRRLRTWLLPAAAAVVIVAGAALAARVTGDDAVTFAAELESTDLAPDISGEATLTRTSSGWKVELDAPGLERLDGGDFYEAWLADGDGVIVSIGTFNEGDEVVLWAGVAPSEFSLLTVTQETSDGDATSSGRRVLAGAITP